MTLIRLPFQDEVQSFEASESYLSKLLEKKQIDHNFSTDSVIEDLVADKDNGIHEKLYVDYIVSFMEDQPLMKYLLCQSESESLDDILVDVHI